MTAGCEDIFAHPPVTELFECPGFKAFEHFNNDRALRMIKDLWYKNSVFYCLSVATYMDSNADGIGDFQGLMRRLDYLSGLGITAIWLMPFQKSPRQGRRLRHLRLLRRQSGFRIAGGFRRIHAWRSATRHPCDHRSRRQPHIE
jgi:hypothetical protein